MTITLCDKCHDNMDTDFWIKLAYHYKNVSLLLIHEHIDGHLNCDMCLNNTNALSNSLQCNWGQIRKRLEVVKLWGARED